VHLRRERRHRPVQPADGIGGFRLRGRQPPASLGQQVLDHRADQGADGLVDQPSPLQAGIAPRQSGDHRPDQRQRFEVVEIEQPGAQSVVDIVVVVGDIVGQRGDLGLGTGERVEFEVVARVVFPGPGRRVGDRAVVLHHAFEGFPGQIEPVELGIAMLEMRQNPQGLVVVVEAAEALHGGVERVFARMSEGGVAEVVGQGQGLGQVLVQPQGAADGAGDLRHFEAVGQPCAVIVALVVHEYLRLVLQAPEGGGVDDAVPVALERGAHAALRLGVQPPARFFRPASKYRQIQ
jgi:hypothetical protein